MLDFAMLGAARVSEVCYESPDERCSQFNKQRSFSLTRGVKSILEETAFSAGDAVKVPTFHVREVDESFTMD